MSNEAITQLPTDIPLYEAFDGEENYTRQAFTIDELPQHLRVPALQKAGQVLAIQPIRFGVPLYESLGMTKAEAEADGRGFLRYRGADLPLDYFWHS